MQAELLMWGIFILVIGALLVLDLGVLHRDSKEIGIAQSLRLSVFYVVISLLFGAYVWLELGPASGKDFLNGYLIEKSLSLDNIFVISLIFSFFKVERRYQHRVLFWGILGVLILRGALISAGAAIVEQFEFVLFTFAGFLILTGVKILFSSDDEEEHDFAANPLLKFFNKYLRFSDQMDGARFRVRLPHPTREGVMRSYFTPLFLCLLMVEFADVIFALDSIPAIFAVTTDPFIIFTSNVFAVLGLRALYFALAAVLHRFEYVKYALAMILIFIGSKVFAEPMLGIEHFPEGLSLGVTVALLAGGIGYSIYRTRGEGADGQ